jgi:transcriptional regulator with XRE-family HTH domain
MKTKSWDVVKGKSQVSRVAQAAIDDEARIAEYRQLAYTVRANAGLTQAQLAERMGTTQSAIARLEGGGTKPTLQTLENLAVAAGLDLVIAIGPALADNRTVQRLVKTNSAIVRRAKT